MIPMRREKPPAEIIADVIQLSAGGHISAPTMRQLTILAAEQIVVALADRGYVIRRHEDG